MPGLIDTGIGDDYFRDSLVEFDQLNRDPTRLASVINRMRETFERQHQATEAQQRYERMIRSIEWWNRMVRTAARRNERSDRREVLSQQYEDNIASLDLDLQMAMTGGEN